MNIIKEKNQMKKKIMEILSAVRKRMWAKREKHHETDLPTGKTGNGTGTGTETDLSKVTAPNSKRKEQKQPIHLTQEVRDFLQAHYDFRYNLLTGETEFRPAGRKEAAFTPVGKRELNSFCMEAHDEGIACWDKDLSRYIYSTYIDGYHPFHHYVDELPEWDGKDRLEPLARRVSDRPIWIESFHKWMLGLTAQWAGMTELHANSVAPVLVSSKQGQRKSTFCKALMPPVLSRYYTDNLKLTAQGKPERLLAEMGLVNMDEFDKYTTVQMPLLKNLMQMANLNICKAYQKNFCNLPRIASFIATSNRFDLLTDPTGSRRFICIEVEHAIDCESIEHDQIFAQLKMELQTGAQYWFSKKEEQEIQLHNTSFYRSCPAEEVFNAYYRATDKMDETCLCLSASEIYRNLQKHNPAAMKGSNPATFAQMLMAMGVTRKHTQYGNVYLLKELKAEQ